MDAEDFLVGMGANAGDRGGAFRQALARLEALDEGSGVRCSRWFRTAPVGGPPGQEWFLNAAAVVKSSLAPEAFLDQLQRIETELGRVRGRTWSSRRLDLDVLLWSGGTIDSEWLQVPHPRLAYRRFVLAPACDVAAARLVPPFRRLVEELLDDLDHTPPAIAFASLDAASTNTFLERLAAEWGCKTLCALSAEERDDPQTAGVARWKATTDHLDGAAQPSRPLVAAGFAVGWPQFAFVPSAPRDRPGSPPPRLLVVPHPRWEEGVPSKLRDLRDRWVREQYRAATLWLGRGKEPFEPLEELTAAWEGIVGPAVPLERDAV